MLKNFVAEVIHATKKFRTKNLAIEDTADINKANIKKATIDEADVGKLVDNGKLYATNSEIRGLTFLPELEPGESPSEDKNCNYQGKIAKPARADHTHHIPVPETFTVQDYKGVSKAEYNGTEAKSIKLTPELSGSAKEMHASASTRYGVGDDTVYGHVKLTDDLDKQYSATDGWAATPKAIRTIANSYLKLDGTSQMTGTIKTKGNSAATPIADMVPAIQVGTNSYITDIGVDNTLAIVSRWDTNKGAIAFGMDKSTILLSKQNGHLYVRNDSPELKEQGFTVEGERMLVDYMIEDFVTPPGANETGNLTAHTWTPARAGWYRIYAFGAGGAGAKGVTYSQKSYLGDPYVNIDKNGNENESQYQDFSHYETTDEPVGIAIAGCGGGGGGVAVLDIYVPTEPYSYVAKKSGKITVEEWSDDKNDWVETSVSAYLESPAKKAVTIKISSTGKYTKITNLFAATGTSRVIESDSIGEDAVGDVDDLMLEDAPVYAFGGFPAVAGSVTTLGSNTSSSAAKWEAEAGTPILNQWWGMRVAASYTWPDLNVTIESGDYFTRQGKTYSGTKASINTSGLEEMMLWTCYTADGVEKFSLIQGLNSDTPDSFQKLIYDANKANSGAFGSRTKFATSYMERVGKGFVVGGHFGFPVIDTSFYKDNFSGQAIYRYCDVIYSEPGLGGHAMGGDVNYIGGSGDVDGVEPSERTGQGTPLVRARDTFGYDMTWYEYPIYGGITFNGDRFPIDYMTCADGCNGGVPGKIGVTGYYGANGGAGDIGSVPTYQGEMVETEASSGAITYTRKDTLLGTVHVRSGYGSGMCITEFGGFTGDGIPSTLAKKSGGPGKYGGGGGGGGAVVSRGKKGAGTKLSHKGAAGGGGCVVIAYLGDSKKKEQSNIIIPPTPTDTNGDGIDDSCEVFLTYTTHTDGSVGSITYDPNTTVVVLRDASGNVYEGGTGTITDTHRPTVTPALGYTGSPIYDPSTTEVDASFDGNIVVRFNKDPSKWFTVSFVADVGGSLTGQNDWGDVLINTPIGAGGITPPTPVASTGYTFAGWVPELPATITADATYTAKFTANK